jgi:hypothetical protein
MLMMGDRWRWRHVASRYWLPFRTATGNCLASASAVWHRKLMLGMLASARSLTLLMFFTPSSWSHWNAPALLADGDPSFGLRPHRTPRTGHHRRRLQRP